MIEVVQGEHLPNMDTGSLTDAYVLLSMKNEENQMICNTKLRTSTAMNSLNPVFHSYQAVPFIPQDSDRIFLEVMDEDLSSTDDEIGHVELALGELKRQPVVTAGIQMATRKRSQDGRPSTLTIRLVYCGVAPLTAPQMQIFAIRHGESKWNQSQSSKNIRGLVSQYDHELTSDGIEQAASFNARWKLSRDRLVAGEAISEDEISDINMFLSAKAIFASPLTRATQTALLTCEDHPLLRTAERSESASHYNMTLLRQIREIKNVGSFDTVGNYSGADIISHVKDVLSRDLGEERSGKVLPDALTIDVNDAIGPWWTPLEVKESSADVRRRFSELWTYLRYGTSADTVILVGHSHFFRFMMREHMSNTFKTNEPQWTEQLSHGKLNNGSCIRVSVAWENSSDFMAAPVINSARLVFGSQLLIEEEKKSSSSFLSGMMSSLKMTSSGDSEDILSMEQQPKSEATRAAAAVGKSL